MRMRLSGIPAILMLAATGTGCGDGGPGLDDLVLTTLVVTPGTAALFTVAPANTVPLSVVAKDQNGAVIGSGSASFTSSNQAVATVSNSGAVTAVSAGTAQITSLLTVGSVSKTAVTTVTVQVAGNQASVTAPQFQFIPDTVDVAAGGAVTWSIGTVHHTVHFITEGAPSDIGELRNASTARTFPTGGTFPYRCTIHTTMTGLVRVH
jgi:plastocyanin